MKTKQRLFGLDFARVVCTLIIVAFHYACHTANEHKLFYTTKIGVWGDIAVTVFFIISGAGLYYVNPAIESPKAFWFKRWKSIFPMFYVAFIYFYMQNAIQAQTLVYGPSPWTLLFSVFGMDGYFLYRFPNYYIIGEWFLGAIILLYLLYPLILRLMKYPSAMPVIIVAGYTVVLGTDFFMIHMFRNLITCMVSFYFGIVVMKYRDLLFNNIVMLIALALFIWLTFFRFPFSIGKGIIVLNQVQGASFFVLLVRVGELIRSFKISSVFTRMSGISYPVFLLHHVLITKLQRLYDPLEIPGEICMLIATIILTVICAKALSVINNAITSSRFFRQLEKI